MLKQRTEWLNASRHGKLANATSIVVHVHWLHIIYTCVCVCATSQMPHHCTSTCTSMLLLGLLPNYIEAYTPPLCCRYHCRKSYSIFMVIKLVLYFFLSTTENRSPFSFAIIVYHIHLKKGRRHKKGFFFPRKESKEIVLEWNLTIAIILTWIWLDSIIYHHPHLYALLFRMISSSLQTNLASLWLQYETMSGCEALNFFDLAGEMLIRYSCVLKE